MIEAIITTIKKTNNPLILLRAIYARSKTRESFRRKAQEVVKTKSIIKPKGRYFPRMKQ